VPVDLEDDFDLDEPFGGGARKEPVRGPRGGLLGRRRARPAGEPEGDTDEERDNSPSDDAFVIRPRISAKQASELAFTDDPLRRR
jgi:hypothetical protein